MGHTWQFIWGLVGTNLKASVALRGAFLLQAFFMMLNNIIFFSVWWIFFHNFEEIRGWTLPDLTALFGIAAGAYGLAMVFGGGTRNLSNLIAEGHLDAFMTQPKNLLVHTVGSHSMAAGWGDILTFAVLVSLSGYLTWGNVPILVVILICSTAMFIATSIIFHSLAFWLGPVDTLARQLIEFVVMFSVYPQTMFSGVMKVVLFTLIPAGFIGYLPVELLRQFHWPYLVAIMGGAVLYTYLATALFHLGLKRYESGNHFSAPM